MKFDRKFTIASFFAVGLLALVVGFYKQPTFLLLLLGIYNITTLLYYRSFKLARIFLFVAIFGALSEIVAVHFGVWTYATPEFLGIPWWLTMVWGHAGIFLAYATRYFKF